MAIGKKKRGPRKGRRHPRRGSLRRTRKETSAEAHPPPSSEEAAGKKVVGWNITLEDLTSYYTFNLLENVVLWFLAGMMLVLVSLAFLGLSWNVPESAQSLLPGARGDVALAISVGTILAMLDALLHYWDKKSNIMASLVITAVMVSGLGYRIIFPMSVVGADVYILFSLLALFLVLDLYVILTGKFPSLLEEHSRSELPELISSTEELQRTIDDLERRLQEEEDKLKRRLEEISSTRSELTRQRQDLVEEEEMLTKRKSELAQQKQTFRQESESLAEEEEILRMKRTEFEELKVEMSGERVQEEEEKLRMKGEELLERKMRLERQGKELEKVAMEMARGEVELQIKRRTLDETLNDMLQEEEHLRKRDEHIRQLRSEVVSPEALEEEESIRGLQRRMDTLKDTLMSAGLEWVGQETEMLKRKEGRLGAVMKDLEERQKEIQQRESEIEQMREQWRLEEEQKLKKKEEELFRLKNETEVKSRLAEELRAQIREKEKELHAIKTEFEKQMRKKMESEEITRIRAEREREREMQKARRVLFPFTAIVGQEAMKRTLILNAVNPLIGGVLIRGQKGTAKSVSVRGLAEILPEIDVVPGCRYNCDPKDVNSLCEECKSRLDRGDFESVKRAIRVVDLPLNVTEDRLIGSIDIEKILREGKKAFEPGLFAECHRGILYVDEINLLDDYIVDLLLDAASMGVVNVEREGISISYPSRFIIVGSMNPEEGELRPQILDRIALQAEVAGIQEVAQRVEIIKRRDMFTRDPERFRKGFESEQRGLAQKIVQAKEMLPRVTTPERLLKVISKLCIDFDTAGHRADIIIERAARTNAAFSGRTETSLEDIAESAVLALPHRMRANPIEGEPFTPESILKRLRRYEKEVG